MINLTDTFQTIFDRLKSGLPNGWFQDSTPNVDALITGAAQIDFAVYSGMQSVLPQMRIRTATGGMLDLIAGDFFGNNLLRLTNETDDEYRIRILIRLFMEQATKKAMSDILGLYTGVYPVIVEYGQAIDTTGFLATSGNETVAGYGSTVKAYHAFITVYQIATSPYANIGGYGSKISGYGVGLGSSYIHEIGYDNSFLNYMINEVKPIGTTCWLKVINADQNTIVNTYGATLVDPSVFLSDSFSGILSDSSKNPLEE